MDSGQSSADSVIACFLRYLLAVDQRRWHDAAAQFVADGILAFGADETVGRASIAGRIEADLGRYALTQHLISTPLVDIDGDSAALTAPAIGMHLRTAGNLDGATVVGGRYQAAFRRLHGGWAIERVAPEYLYRGGPPLDH